MKIRLTFSVLSRLITAALLFWALSRHQYGYYTLLRWITCAISAYCGYLSHTLRHIPWVWVFGFIAILFNPIAPIRLDRETWTYVDVATGILFLVSIFFIQESQTSKGDANV